jgi:hypothetical protein
MRSAALLLAAAALSFPIAGPWLRCGGDAGETSGTHSEQPGEHADLRPTGPAHTPARTHG